MPIYKIYLTQKNMNMKERIQPAWDRAGWTLTQRHDWAILIQKELMQCNKCKKHKDESEFHKRDTKRGYQSWCKECQVLSAKNRFKSYYQENIERFRKKGNEQYHRNKKRISELRKINRQRIREGIIEHYSDGLKKCACCGEKRN